MQKKKSDRVPETRVALLISLCFSPAPPCYLLQPGARVLGYFASAWRVRCVVRGRPFEGGRFAKSRRAAENLSAQAAFDYFRGTSGPRAVGALAVSAASAPAAVAAATPVAVPDAAAALAGAAAEAARTSRVTSGMFVPRQARRH